MGSESFRRDVLNLSFALSDRSSLSLLPRLQPRDEPSKTSGEEFG
uniref:Uncharacterized protein n=1 Tax=Rhizophora mucronata TaxID=61149 RepID=A0A2P2P7S7_RHIMU